MFLSNRDGNLILTALAIGGVPLINAAKSLGFVLAQEVLKLAWASGRVLIPNPGANESQGEYMQYAGRRGLMYFWG